MARAMFQAVLPPAAAFSPIAPFQIVEPKPRMLMVCVAALVPASLFVKAPLTVSKAPPSRLLLMVHWLLPPVLRTPPLSVIFRLPAKTAVELLPATSLLVTRSAPKANIPPLLRKMPEALPMPAAVRPSNPPLTVMEPLNVLFDGGLRIQTPPSFLTILSAGVLVPVLFVRTALSWFASVLEPRSSRLRKRLPAPAA